MKRSILLAGALLACTATLFADFSYVETTNLTGGSMAGAMKFAGKLGGGGSGVLKGAFGGFGGFGRKKERDPEPQQSSGTPTAAEAGVLMEMTTLYSDFSNSTISADTFRPDPSLKKVESKMLKQLSK